MATTTLDKITAVDGQTISISTRIDSDGLLRIDVIRQNNVVCSAAVTALDRTRMTRQDLRDAASQCSQK